MAPSSPTRESSPMSVGIVPAAAAAATADNVSSPCPTTPPGPAKGSIMNNNSLPSRSSLRNDASGLPPCLRRFHEQRKRASEEAHHRTAPSVPALPPAFQSVAGQRERVLQDLTCKSSIPSPRLRIQRNLSLKRASWQQLVRSTEQIETIKMLKEVARQARLLSMEEAGERTVDPPTGDCCCFSPDASPKAMIQLSTSQHKKRTRRRQQQRKGLKDRRLIQAATRIQAGYRMYRCRLVYLRDILPISARKAPLQRNRTPPQRNTSEITMSDFSDTKHTLENTSLHLLMQKASRHTAVSDLDDSFASLGDIPFSPKTNMERYNNSNNHNSLSSSLKVASGISPLPSPPPMSGVVSSSGADAFPSVEPPLVGSFSSLPGRPAMLSSTTATTSATTNSSTITEAAFNTSLNMGTSTGHYSCSSFFAKDEQPLDDRPPLDRLDSSFRRTRMGSCDDILSPKVFSSSGHASFSSCNLLDTPARRPDRLPSAHVRKEDFDDDEDDDSDNVSLDVQSFVEDITNEHDYATTTTMTTMSEDMVPIEDDPLVVSTRSTRWSDDPVDLEAVGHMSCMSYFVSARVPDTPVRRPTRTLSPRYLSCPTQRKTSIRRPEPERDDCDDLQSPRAPSRRISSQHFLQMMTGNQGATALGLDLANDTQQPQDAPIRAPTRKNSNPSGDDVSVSSALSTGPSLHRRLEQYVRPGGSFTQNRNSSDEDSAGAPQTQRQQPQKSAELPPPAPPSDQRTPPAPTWSGDTLITMPARKQSLETTVSSSAATGSVKSASIHESSPKCIMELASTTMKSVSSSPSSFANDDSDGTI